MTARSAPAPHFYPAFLDVRDRRCVVVGGGRVAEQKVLGLLEAGASVTVVSPVVTPRLLDLASGQQVALLQRPYRRGDLSEAFLAIGATDDGAINRDLWEEAEQRGIPFNAVDDLRHCSFIAPSIHRQGDITVAVSTGGKSPALAVRLRQRVARMIGPAEARLCRLLGELRPEVTARVPDATARTALWYRIVDSDTIDFVRREDVAGARRRIEELIHDGGRSGPGVVYLVGAGPGDAGLITVRGLDLLRSADVVVYDRLVHPDLVNAAPPRAERVFVGKEPGGHAIAQDQINALLVASARAARVVVRLKGGDPFVFGRGAEECEALRAAGVPFEVVPGVTSAVAAAGAAGIPVTDRRYGSAFAVVAGHQCDGRSDLDWAALARIPTLVFLMGLRALSEITLRLVEQGMSPQTPAAVVASATLPNEETVVGTLATVAELVHAARLEPPATLIVGDVVRMRETLAVVREAAARKDEEL